jgi:hypothetical protein
VGCSINEAIFCNEVSQASSFPPHVLTACERGGRNNNTVAYAFDSTANFIYPINFNGTSETSYCVRYRAHR